jgi:3-oxoacyl-[acyl-carrier protein] reductase
VTMTATKSIDLTGKVAFITAGANGVGEGIALSLAKHGADIAIADIDPENGGRVVAEVQSMARNALFIEINARDANQLQSAVDQAADHFGRLDILVNNAGGVRKRPFLEQSLRSWQNHIDLNFISMLAATQSAAKHMIAGQAGGTIINIASSEGLRAAPNFAVYAACKAGMVSFTRSMALELAEHNIHVHALAPDMIETEGLKPHLDAQGEAGRVAMRNYIPLGRAGSLEEIGNVATFLVSDMASYLNGLTIPVDGGAIASSGWSRSPQTGEWDLYHG